jgi:hypothetical protein
MKNFIKQVGMVFSMAVLGFLLGSFLGIGKAEAQVSNQAIWKMIGGVISPVVSSWTVSLPNLSIPGTLSTLGTFSVGTTTSNGRLTVLATTTTTTIDGIALMRGVVGQDIGIKFYNEAGSLNNTLTWNGNTESLMFTNPTNNYGIGFNEFDSSNGQLTASSLDNSAKASLHLTGGLAATSTLPGGDVVLQEGDGTTTGNGTNGNIIFQDYNGLNTATFIIGGIGNRSYTFGDEGTFAIVGANLSTFANDAGFITNPLLTSLVVSGVSSSTITGDGTDSTLGGNLVLTGSAGSVGLYLDSAKITYINGTDFNGVASTTSLGVGAADGQGSIVFDTHLLSGNQTITFPDKTGTVAYTDDLVPIQQKGATILSATTSDSIVLMHADLPITISKISCVVRGTGSTVTFQMPHSTDRSTSTPVNLFSTGQACANTTSSLEYTSFNDATIGADEMLWLTFSVASSTETHLEIFFTYD